MHPHLLRNAWARATVGGVARGLDSSGADKKNRAKQNRG